MAKRLGRVATLDVAQISETPQWKKVGRVVDATLNVTRSEIDVSDQDNKNTEYYRGRADFTIDGTLRYDPQDEGQEILEESFFADGEEPNIMVRWRSKPAVGEKEYIAKAFVTNWTQSRPDEAPQDMTFTIRLSGDFEPQEQTGP